MPAPIELDIQRRAFFLLRDLLDLPDHERESQIASVCGNDPPLIAQVRRMLAAHAEPGILDSDAAEVAARLSDEAAMPIEFPTGTHIGDWCVREFLGHGGMGSVFLVEREGDRYTQRGALKVIRRGMDTQEVIERFRSERRILARLQHPQIARLLDGGVSPSGQLYFVMEYVDGVALGDWVERSQADASQRIALFLKLADAVAYAHSCLVVHRDLKPGNVLVDEHDEPHLLDFGVAKVLEDVDDAGRTATAQRFLSRAYAAPEQIRGEAPGTAADVYSLGALLFELLTGVRLHDVADSGAAASDRLSRAAARSTHPAALPARHLRGDLGIIVARATDPDPGRRYATVQAFADDLRRFRDGVAILARGDSAIYRFRRFIQRHAVASAAASIAVLGLLVGGGVALWQAGRATAEAARARAAQGFLLSVFDASAPDAAAGARISARDLLDQGAARIEQELGDQAGLRVEMQHTLGILYRQLGQFEQADALLSKALHSASKLGDKHAALKIAVDEARVMRERGLYQQAEDLLSASLIYPPTAAHASDAWSERALVDEKQGRFQDGLQDIQAAQRIDAKRGDEGAADRARDRYFEAFLLGRLGQFEHADAAFRDAIAQHIATYGEQHTRVASVRQDYASMLVTQQRSVEAESQLRAVLEIRRRRLGQRHALIGETLQTLGAALRQQGKLDEAGTMLAEGLDIQRAALGERHPDVATTLNSLGMLAMSRQRFDEAIPRLGEALQILRENHLADAPPTVAVASNLGVMLTRLNRLDEAEPLLRGALQQHRKSLGDVHPLVMSDLNGLSQLERRRGRFAQAEAAATEAVAIADKVLGESRDSAGVRLTLAAAQLGNGHAGPALDNFQKVTRLLDGIKAQTDPRYPVALTGQVKAYLALGEAAQARVLAEQVLAMRQNGFAADNGGLALTHSLLARVARIEGKLNEARDSSGRAELFLAKWTNPDIEVAAEIRTNAKM